ncbi:MAG TPA: alpha/beta hydrolase [Verrucomicrobiae bacterium]
MRRTLTAAFVTIAAVYFFVRTNAAELSLPTSATNSVQEWENYRAKALERMQEVMGALPKHARTVDLQAKIVEKVDCGEYVRRLITYVPEPDSIVPAYLLIPKRVINSKEKSYAVLAFHQTRPEGHKVVVGLAGGESDHYGVELVKRGYMCIAPPYPLLADYAPDLKALGYASGTMKAIWDNMRALDYLETLPFVHKGKFAAIGHSLGGHNSLYTAAFDERIKAVATSCGFDSFRDYMGGNINGWTSERYMPRFLDYKDGNYPFDFHDVLAVIAPRRIFVSAPIGDTNFKWESVDGVVAAARPVFELYGAAKNIRIEHPEIGHLFSKQMREAAYRMIEETLPLDR